MSGIFAEISVGGHNQVLFFQDTAAGYCAIIAIHSTVLGPAVGGTRLWCYPDTDAALRDVLRLSRGMTYKTALAGLPFGGGKAVILEPAGQYDRDQLFRAHARSVHSLGGRFITAEDVGTGVADVDLMRTVTPWVAGFGNGSGDPSPFTARGVLAGMRAAAVHRWGGEDLGGRTVALQGCGAVGYQLARLLAGLGARLIVCDAVEDRARRVAAEFDARVVDPGDIYDARADIFAPCALGGTLNDDTIPRLQVEIVAGAANNQLLEPRHDALMAQRGITWAPDYVANAGGAAFGCAIEQLGEPREVAIARVDAIFDTMLRVFGSAIERAVPPGMAADALAEEILGAASTERDGDDAVIPGKRVSAT